MPAHKKRLSGLIASEGMALGRACILKPFKPQPFHKQISARAVASEITRFEAAIVKSRQQMQELLKHTRLTDDLESIFEAQLLILEDPMLIGESQEKIRLRQINAEWALEGELRILKDFLLKSENSVFQERADDLEDVGNRIIRNLMGTLEKEWSNTFLSEYRGSLILMSDKITPSMFLQLSLNQIEGLVSQSGGITSHLAILSKSHNIPALVQVEYLLETVQDKTPVFLNCIQGELVLEPDEEEQQIYRIHLVETAKSQALSVTSPVKTSDGTPVEFWVNLDEAEASEDERISGLNGVGLFRTEFLYMKNPKLLTMPHEHNAIYMRILKNLKPKPVQFRLLDVGNDKSLPRQLYSKQKGLYGIRFLLSNRSLLISQLESILIAAGESEYPDGQCRILLPMVSNLEEIQTVKEILEEIRSELEARTFQRLPRIPLGIMMETPGAVEMADTLAQHVFCFCVGSNDLVRLDLAFERDSNLVSQELLYHPAFYRQLKKLVSLSKIPLLLCGAIAGETKLLPLLLGLGVRRFSTPLSASVNCARIIEESKRKKCQNLARQALAVNSATELRQLIEESQSSAAPIPIVKNTPFIV